jgi:hypothetical protein
MCDLKRFCFFLLGRVCVPIDPFKCEDFDPFEAPLVASLIDEINMYDAEHKDAMEADTEKCPGMTNQRFYLSPITNDKNRLRENNIKSIDRLLSDVFTKDGQ